MWYVFWGVLLLIMLILSSLFASFTVINDTSGIINPMVLLIHNNKLTFLVWHIFLYFAIFAGLYLYAKHLIKKYKYNKKYNKKSNKEAIIFCLLSVMLIITIDSFYYLRILS